MTIQAKSIVTFSAVIIVGIMIAGCKNSAAVISQKKQYVLDAVRQPADPQEKHPGVLKVRRFNVSSRFGSYELVYRTGDLTYESDFYNKFFAPPGALVTEETRKWLNQGDVFDTVLDMLSTADYDYVLEGDVQALYCDCSVSDQHTAVMEIRFVLIDVARSRETVTFDKIYRATRELGTNAASDLVKGLSECLSQILTRLESDLRKMPAHKAPGE
jgi:cholesterol transport system auxiliary component